MASNIRIKRSELFPVDGDIRSTCLTRIIYWCEDCGKPIRLVGMAKAHRKITGHDVKRMGMNRNDYFRNNNNGSGKWRSKNPVAATAAPAASMKRDVDEDDDDAFMDGYYGIVNP